MKRKRFSEEQMTLPPEGRALAKVGGTLGRKIDSGRR